MKISIIIPTYNYEKYIPRAIRSCLEQSFPRTEYEIIVVDDGSTDSSPSILASYGHWIKVITHEENRGLPWSRNNGIMSAAGQYIVHLDADDYIHRDFLKVCLLYLEFNNYDAVATDYFIVDDNEMIIKRIDVHTCPIACGIMFRKEQVIDVGMYDTALRIGEDVDFRIRFDKKYSTHRVNLPLYRYRMHDSNLTADLAANQNYLDMVAIKNGCSITHQYHSERYSTKCNGK